MYVYLPSCNFTRACPSASKKMQQYLRGQPDIKLSGCCRPTQQLLGPEDTALTVCLFCSAITQEVSPKTEQLSIWEYLLADVRFPWPDYGGERMVIQDCRRACNQPKLLDDVRRCMKRMNLVPVELAENREKSNFDGVWPFESVPQRNLDIAPVYFGALRDYSMELMPPEEQQRRMVAWVCQYTTDRVAAYCPACLKGVRLGGANGVHLMELATSAIALEDICTQEGAATQ